MDHISAVLGTGKYAACLEIRENELQKVHFTRRFGSTNQTQTWNPAPAYPNPQQEHRWGTSSKFHSWSCYLQVSEQLEHNRSRFTSWTEVPCGMCDGGQALTLPRLLSTDQDQRLTALAHPYMIWSHLSSLVRWHFSIFCRSSCKFLTGYSWFKTTGSFSWNWVK